MKLALVLSSGFARGLSHIGVIEELEHRGINFDLIIGSSMGAVVGGYYALTGDIAQTKKVALETNWRRIIPWTKIKRGFFLDNAELKKFINHLFGDSLIEKFKIPFRALTINFQKPELITINGGLAASAIVKSVAAPPIFPPIIEGKKIFIDSVFMNPLPIELALKERADFVIASDASRDAINHRIQSLNEKLISGKIVSSAGIWNAATQLSQYQIVQRQIDRYRKDALVITPKVGSIGLLDFDKAQELIKLGKEAVGEVKNELIKRGLKYRDNYIDKFIDFIFKK